ncbi:MAG: hypothetical protein J7484_07935 [Microbacterium sp.]|nr:hypothetical protein [Microbacterium sp.]
MSDPKNTQGTPGPDEEADTASGGAPEKPSAPGGAPEKPAGPEKPTDDLLDEETTDENGAPLDNPSGG